MRLASPCILAALCIAPLACKKKAAPHTIGLALDVGGRGDQSFNDGTLRGLEVMAAGLRYTAHGYEPLPDDEYRKIVRGDAPAHLRIPPPIVLQGKAQEDYEPNLQLLVDQGAELVVAVGFMMEPAARKVARDNPRTKFLLIDSPVLDDAGRPTTLPNVRAVVFREHEGSFLVGALAGELTRSGKVGFVGGMQLPLIEKFEVGFRAGVRTVNPAAAHQVMVVYTGSFDDERKGIEVGQDLYRRGCDIVFHGAGLDGLGVIKAAEQANRWVVGVDSDQSHVAPRNVLTSMVKRADLVVYQSVRDVVEGTFTGGHLVLGLKEGAVGLAPLGGNAEPAIGPDARAAAARDVDVLRQAVVAGRIAVPATPEELSRFAPPPPEALGLVHAVAHRP
ncbi:MAG TPA: BMP family ABC transporter substrate-binding protein [Myxococcales bacterium]|nr:BMP family ABC transporter substrate-binding protein [Myxococcales bacterium]